MSFPTREAPIAVARIRNQNGSKPILWILELDDWKTQLSAMEQGDLLNQATFEPPINLSGTLLGETEKLLATEK